MKDTAVTELEVFGYEHMSRNIQNDPTGEPSDQDVADSFTQGFLCALDLWAEHGSANPNLTAAELYEALKKIATEPYTAKIYCLVDGSFRVEWGWSGKRYFKCSKDESLHKKAREVSGFNFFDFSLLDKDGNPIPAFA